MANSIFLCGFQQPLQTSTSLASSIFSDFFHLLDIPSLKRTFPRNFLTSKNFVPDHFLICGNPCRILFIMVSHGGSHVINTCMGF